MSKHEKPNPTPGFERRVKQLLKAAGYFVVCDHEIASDAVKDEPRWWFACHLHDGTCFEGDRVQSQTEAWLSALTHSLASEDFKEGTETQLRNRMPSNKKRRLTNTEFITLIMEFSKCGALMQAFVMEALSTYAQQCEKAGPAVSDSPMLNGAAWHACAIELSQAMTGHFSHVD